MLKRQGAIQTYTPAKRIRLLENRVNKIYRRVNTKCSRNALSMSSATFGTGTLSALALNDSSVHMDIKVHYVKVFAYAENIIDIYLVSTPTSTAPVYADFSNNIGAILTDTAYESGMRVLHHRLLPQDSKVASFGKKIPRGILIPQSSVGALEGKCLWLVVKNDTGSTIAYQTNIEIWYTRATT